MLKRDANHTEDHLFAAIPSHLLPFLLCGLMTLNETTEFLASPAATTIEKIRQVLEQRRGRSLKAMIGREPSISQPAASRDELEQELTRLRPEIRTAFLEGKITLIQARFAERMKISGERFADFLRVNDVSGKTTRDKTTRRKMARRKMARRKRELAELEHEFSLPKGALDRHLESDVPVGRIRKLELSSVLLRQAEQDGLVDSREAEIWRDSGILPSHLQDFLDRPRRGSSRSAGA